MPKKTPNRNIKKFPDSVVSIKSENYVLLYLFSKIYHKIGLMGFFFMGTILGLTFTVVGCSYHTVNIQSLNSDDLIDTLCNTNNKYPEIILFSPIYGGVILLFILGSILAFFSTIYIFIIKCRRGIKMAEELFANDIPFDVINNTFTEAPVLLKS